MTYRLLPSAEWDALAPIFRHYGGALPTGAYAQLAVAEEDGLIVGFLARQLATHIEPLWIAPTHRGRVYLRPLFRLAEADLGPGQAFAFATSEQTAGIARAMGYREVPYRVFQKEVG